MSVSSAIEILEIAANEMTYLPTPEQRKAKSAFWARFNENPICEPQDISLSIALRFVADGRLSKWWPQDGFKEWFRNRDEFRQRLEYLANLGLDRLEAILADPKANPSAQVNAVKLLMEAARKMPSKTAVEQYLDEKIGQMDKKQLEEFIRARTPKLVAAPTEQDTNSIDKPESI